MKLSTNYTFSDIPTNRPFEYEGMTITKLLGGALRVEAVNISLLGLMFLGPNTDTGVKRDIFTINQSQIMASMGHVFLIASAPDEFYIEEYDASGTVHYAQYFTNASAAGRQFTKQTLSMMSDLL